MAGVRFRTIYGSLILAGVALLIYVDGAYLGTLRPLGSLMLVALALLGWGEYARITGLRGSGPKACPSLDLLGLAAVLGFFIIAWGFRPGQAGLPILPWHEAGWLMCGLGALLLTAFCIVVVRADFLDHYQGLLETIAGALVLGFLFSYLLRIYHLPGWDGPVLGAIFVGGVKGNDSAAYYTGKAWGKRHILKVSPRKTLEGCVGAIVFSSIYFLAWSLALPRLGLSPLFPWWGGILFGMILSIVSQVGDLAESLVKRVYQVKDSGSLLPEFGGVLDMIDSLLFSGLVFWVGLQAARPAV